MESPVKKNILTAVGALIILGAAFGVGFSQGRTHPPPIEKVTELQNKEEGKPTQVDFAPFWKTWNLLNEKFVGSTTTPDQDKVWGAIEGLAASYKDPYTVFLPPEETKAFESEIRGSFEGVGMEIGIKDEQLTVVAPLKGTPAERAGLLPGDRILKIDDKVTLGMSVEQAVRMIRGPKGTPVRLTVSRNGTRGPFEVSIVRETIAIPTIDTEVRVPVAVSSGGEVTPANLRDGVFILKLHNFSSVSPALFRDALRQFIQSGSTKLVLDLRGNPGGYLEAAVDMASFFLPAGKVVVKEAVSGGEEGRVYRSRGYDVFNDQLKIAVLINNGSASASEILAGALREHGKAKLIGVKTFGKGSVQEVVPITDDTSLKVTIARWLTPNGVSISEGGLTPDIEVPMTPEDIEKDRDPQLDKAIELLGK
jgi:carboxyl-terminal processing protease